MDQTQPLTLIANPGSASRKYALYQAEQCLLKIHFEYLGDKIVYSLEQAGTSVGPEPADISHLTFAANKLLPIILANLPISSKEQIKLVAIRVVAPSTYFQKDRVLSKKTIDQLTKLEPRAPLHINATLQEIHALRRVFPKAVLAGMSDSAFHNTMSEVAKYYALPPDKTAKLEIRRFGYHGLSAESIVSSLKAAKLLPKRLIVCHLGSGVSVTALLSGKSLDTTMGYSPLEGLMMSTRSGNVDITALMALQDKLKLTKNELQDLLNLHSGLLGVSQISSDVRILLQSEKDGSKSAKLALNMYVHRIVSAIGQMTANLGGVDGLVFTGTVGERSAEIRKRIVRPLMFLGLMLDARANHQKIEQLSLLCISPKDHPAKVYITHCDEDLLMARRAQALL
ncbi:hypothetical protein A3E49_01670 [Candidatus Saccharibacteria bacterium RIFCSPHIGHO2_12_FULL_49_19]|nr:MAG: hypothetical protein A3E49_01670 [Candidatus Saccharibacteria bacterium RIFCSPHIGHO2_12_FULL_49_19]OGL38019.1 MAG: hypothetical protein A3B63_03265 [Candidatus Saccharibacteria bacterium RIFCSPLOWO2_01_FULL_49_22]